MSQQEILRFLKQNPDKKYYTKEISMALGIASSSVSVNLRHLRKANFVSFEYINHGRTILHWHKE